LRGEIVAGGTAVTGGRAAEVPGAAVPERSEPRTGALARLEMAATPYRLGVAGISACVALFLLLRLHAWPPHEDEAVAYFVSREPFGDLFRTVLGQRGGAPLHFVLTHLVELVWPGLTGIRLISVAFAVASIPVGAALVARLADRRTALVASVIVAASWTLLFHGIYGRMYSLFLCTGALSMLTLLRALERQSKRRWLAWSLATYACLATQPYAAFLAIAEAILVLARRRRMSFSLWPSVVAFGAVAIASLPLAHTYLHLASRYEVGVGGGGTKLNSPLAILEYLRSVVADFTTGYLVFFVLVAALALLGLVTLARTRPLAAVLAVAVFAVPAVGLSLMRLGAMTFPETRHLIFALPLLAMLVAAGLLRAIDRLGASGRAALPLALGVLVAAELAWGWQTTPTLYAGEQSIRVTARHAAAGWLARTSRPNDILFGFDPLFMEASEDGGPLGRVIVPRADPTLAVDTLLSTSRPLGRGVWVLDASDTGNYSPKLTIPDRSPGPAFSTRVFGPFLVVRTKAPVQTVQEFFRDTVRVERVGQSLLIGDADVNYQTGVLALARLGVRG